MIRYLLPTLLLAAITPAFSQQVFFRSGQTFSKDNMREFYSSVAIEDDLILFNANDYKVYAYRKMERLPGRPVSIGSRIFLLFSPERISG